MNEINCPSRIESNFISGLLKIITGYTNKILPPRETASHNHISFLHNISK